MFSVLVEAWLCMQFGFQAVGGPLMIQIDMEQVVRKAAKDRNLDLRPDDPALVFAGVINLMLEDLEKSMLEVVQGCRVGNEELSKRWRGDAEAAAVRMLNAALDAGREAASQIISEGADKTIAVVHGEFLSAMLRQKSDLEDCAATIRRWSFFMLLASGAVLASAVLARVL
jgi:hypothetical protein